jgi:hypothetical protein
MLTRPALVAALGATLAAGSLAFAPAARADRLNFSLSLAGPGYGVTVGNAPYYAPYRPYYRHWHRAPAYVPPRVVYQAPVVVSPPPVYYSAPAYYPAPAYYSGRVYYRR